MKGQNTALNSFIRNKDIYGTRNFIENKGQFVNPLKEDEKVLFVYEHEGEKIYFTQKGLIYELEKAENLTEEEHEALEHGQPVESNSSKKYYVSMNWLHANSNIELKAYEKQSHYLTYGASEFNSFAYKKLVYKNVYDHIDIEYIIPENKNYGIKYNIILHPGADIDSLNMAYTGDVKKIKITTSGDIVIKTPLNDIVEHAPVSFYSNQVNISSSFILKENTIKFQLPAAINTSMDLIIDPWVTAITTLSVNNCGYDVDYDSFGSTFVYGGNNSTTTSTARCKIAKYNSLGVLQWTFSGMVTTPSWNTGSAWSSNFKVEKLTSKIYVGRNNGSPNLIRLDAQGNYDNFITSNIGSILEVWHIDIACNGDLVVFGGGPTSIEIVNPVTASISLVTTVNPTITGCCQDVLSEVFDNSGDVFVYFSGMTQLNNSIVKVSPGYTNSTWTAPSNYSTFTYLASKNSYVSASAGSAVAFNALAVNANYLYYYDGLNIAAYNKTNGALLGSTIVPGLTAKEQGGIAVDECNNVYVGGNGSIVAYNFSGTSFSTLTPISLNTGLSSQYVYDVQLDRASNMLHVTGSGFVATYSAIHSTLCTVYFCNCTQPLFSINTTSTICANIGTSTVSISGIPGPYTYSWTPGNLTGSVVTGLNPGTYTITATSQSCNTSYTATTTFTSPATPYSVTVNSSSITCANLGSATVSTSGLLPPYSYTWLPTAQTGSAATGLNPGTYTLTVFSGGCNFTFTTTTAFTSLIPLSGNLLNSNSITCHGATTGSATVNNLAGGSGTQNYLWTDGINTQTTVVVNNLSAGLHTVSVTDALTGCQIYQVFYISQPPALSLNMTSNTPSICLGSGITLTGANSGGTPLGTGAGYTYTWSGGPITDTYVVNQSIAGPYVYTLTSSDANNCQISNTISVDFVPNPVVSVAHVSICPLQTGTLTASGATSYTWSNNSSGATFTSSPLTSQQYSVIGSALGCSSIATASIILKPNPTVFISSNSPRCIGDNLALAAFGGTSFAWSGPNSFTAAIQGPGINPVGVIDAGVYTASITAANSCTAAISTTVTINLLPTVSAAANTVCTSQTLNLTSNTPAGSTYLWTGPQNFSSNQQNPTIVNPIINQSGTYTVKVTSSQGCTNTALADAVVVPPPSLSFVMTGNGTLCAQPLNGSPNSVTLSFSGANTYTLTTPGHILNPVPNGSVSPLTSIAPYISGMVTATLQGSNGICSSSTSVTFSVIPNPTVTLNSLNPSVCAGQTYTYNSFGASSYLWDTGATGLNTYFGSVTIAQAMTTSTYAVTGASLGCNSATQTSTLTIKPLPVISIIPSSPSICLNSKINLIAIGNAENYSWAPFSGLNAVNGETVMAGPFVQQTYTLLGSLNSCTANAMVTVSVLPLPSPSIVISKSTLCVNDTFDMIGSGGFLYEWRGPSDLYHVGQVLSAKATNKSFEGTYTLTVADTNNCKASTTTLLNIQSLPEGNLVGSKMQGCVPFTTNFVFYSSKNTLSEWVLDGKQFKGDTFSYRFNRPGIYTVTGNYVDTLTLCATGQIYKINVWPVPTADFDYLPEHPVEGYEEVFFTNTSRGAELNKWSWFFITNEGYKTESRNASYLFKDPGSYPVAMIVTNSWNCSDTMIKSVTVDVDFNFYVPNVFSPNNDKLNDVFLPVLRGVKLYELSVFNRWGSKIFEVNDLQVGWDGNYQGNPCANDSYVWKIKLSTNRGEIKNFTGHVLLSR